MIPCRKCGGSKNSTANKFTVEFKSLRCTHCDINGMEECPACVERRKELEAELKRKELQQEEECKSEETREVERAERREEVRREDEEQLHEKEDNNTPDTKENNSTEVENESIGGDGIVDMADSRDDDTEGEQVERGVRENEKKDRDSDVQSKDSDSEENTIDIEALEKYIQDIVF